MCASKKSTKTEEGCAVLTFFNKEFPAVRRMKISRKRKTPWIHGEKSERLERTKGRGDPNSSQINSGYGRATNLEEGEKSAFAARQGVGKRNGLQKEDRSLIGKKFALKSRKKFPMSGGVKSLKKKKREFKRHAFEGRTGLKHCNALEKR